MRKIRRRHHLPVDAQACATLGFGYGLELGSGLKLLTGRRPGPRHIDGGLPAAHAEAGAVDCRRVGAWRWPLHVRRVVGTGQSIRVFARAVCGCCLGGETDLGTFTLGLKKKKGD